MEFISLIIYGIFTLTLTSSNPIDYKSAQIRGMENKYVDNRKICNIRNNGEITFDQTKSLVISKTTGKTIENNTGKGNKVLFQKDITTNGYPTVRRNHQEVAVADTSIHADDSSERPLQWTLPDSRRWFETLIASNGSVIKSVQQLRQATTPAPQLTNRPNRRMSSYAPSPARSDTLVACVAYEHSKKCPLSSRKENRILTANAISPMPRNSNNNYVAISMFDDHGHIVRRMVQRNMIRVITTSTQNVLN